MARQVLAEDYGPRLDWVAVAKALDHERFNIPDQASVAVVVDSPVGVLFSFAWFSFLAVSYLPVCAFYFYFQVFGSVTQGRNRSFAHTTLNGSNCTALHCIALSVRRPPPSLFCTMFMFFSCIVADNPPPPPSRPPGHSPYPLSSPSTRTRYECFSRCTGAPRGGTFRSSPCTCSGRTVGAT